jgi:myo-inositol-1(or 4)-monophosphatase
MPQPPIHKWNLIKRSAILAAKKSGRYLLSEFRKPQVKVFYKKDYSPVTFADRKSERTIRQVIKKIFPDHNILGEEYGEGSRRSCYEWLIDPIDGTTNFVLRNPMFCISIALVYQQEVIFGLTYAPVTNEMFWGIQNKGAWLNGRRIKVSESHQLSKSILTRTFAKNQENRLLKLYPKILPAFKKVRQFGSCALELSYLAAGRTDAAISLGIHAYDAAAGAVIAREAGAKITNLYGRSWQLTDRDVAATNGLLHNKFLALVKKAKI